ncbi:hypothetical protein JOF53_000024 [Crossiella equi]|uniref:RNA polymerase sigma-70 region 2 domain-containing protein n=1 Tax=Crossiella equi TaxID=130796 RepID=A0ABS5A4J2_9PSEU|nr:hypothetical protein [Crossiella equi]MBP2471152.1 hypothetical protein [Crossiella equi]
MTAGSWWQTAPLGPAGRRDLARLAPSLMTEVLDQAMGLARHAIRAQHSALRELLGGPDDLTQQLRLWILEAAATYDPARGPWTAHLTQRVRHQAGDHWRAVVGQCALRRIRRYRADGTPLTGAEQLHVARILSLLPGRQHQLNIADCSADPSENHLAVEQSMAAGTATLAYLHAVEADEEQHARRLRQGFVVHVLRHLHGQALRRIAPCGGMHHRTSAAVEEEFQQRVRDLLQPPG